MTDTYTLFLKELADHLTSSDVEIIKFILPNDFPAGLAESLNNSRTLLAAMDHAKIISKHDIEKLYMLFENIPRKDLIPKLDKFKDNIMPDVAESDVAEGKTPEENCIDELHPISSENVDDEKSLSIETPSLPPLPYIFNKDSNISMSPQGVKLMTPGDFRVKATPDGSKYNNQYDVDGFKYPTIADRQRSPHQIRPTKTERQRSSHQIRPEEYSMKRHPHGTCIIFSNRFDTPIPLNEDRVLGSRIGTEKDVTMLTRTFEWLSFEVTVHRNQSGESIIKMLKDISYQREQENNDCFICCILSHGYDGGFYGNDGTMVDMAELKKIFEGDRCASLINKPKLFFIQACQGENDGKGVHLQADGAECHVFAQDQLGETSSSSENYNRLVYQDSIATDADFLFFTASTPGTISWRDQEKGSWFVQTLCSIFQDYAYSWPLMDMLLQVNHTIALKKEPLGMGVAKQMSNFNNTMRKKLYFHPQNNNFGGNEKGNEVVAIPSCHGN